MATVKSYTDLGQSKKLAEILPIESADMGWNVFVDDTTRILPINDWDLVKDGSGNVKFYHAWSLAALLELLPKRLEIVDNFYELSVYLYGLYYWNINNGNPCFESKYKDNLVDACYELILKLHELNLL